MALEFICKIEILNGRKISVPKGARKFKTESGAIKFYSVNNSGPANLNKKIREVPSGAQSIVFKEFQVNAYSIYYGAPTFYDGKGRVIEMF